MKERILITGGAGFIGYHVADRLLEEGYRVRVLANLSPQVHGECEGPPHYLTPEVEFVQGDVRDSAAVGRALTGGASRSGIRSVRQRTKYGCRTDLSKSSSEGLTQSESFHGITHSPIRSPADEPCLFPIPCGRLFMLDHKTHLG